MRVRALLNRRTETETGLVLGVVKSTLELKLRLIYAEK